MGLKNIFKDRVKPNLVRSESPNLASQFEEDKAREKAERPVKKIKPKRAISNLVAKLSSFQADKTKQKADVAKNQTKSRTSRKMPGTKTVANLIAKLPNFSQDETRKKELEIDIEKVDRTLIANAVPHKKIVAIFRRMAMNVQPESIDKIVKKLPKMNRGAVKEVWTQVQTLLATIGDPNIAWKSKTLAIAALVYLVSPIDAIPDLLPGIGLTDDVALIVAVVYSLTHELGNYLEKSADKGVEIASELADIQVKKYNKIIRLGLIGSIVAGIIAILVQFFIKQMG